jgi:hypothetical protein
MSDVSATGTGATRSKPPRPTKRQRAAAKAAATTTEATTAPETPTEAAPAVPETMAFQTNGTRHDGPAAERVARAGVAAAPTPPPAPVSGEVIDPAPEGSSSIDAERVSVRMSAIGRVQGTDLTVEQGAVGAARTEHLSVERGAVGAAMADRVELSRSYGRSILARQVQLDRSAARIVIAADVRATQSAAMFLVARKVDGNVKVLFDWRGALAFGAVAGIVFALLSRMRPRGGRAGGKKAKS